MPESDQSGRAKGPSIGPVPEIVLDPEEVVMSRAVVGLYLKDAVSFRTVPGKEDSGAELQCVLFDSQRGDGSPSFRVVDVDVEGLVQHIREKFGVGLLMLRMVWDPACWTDREEFRRMTGRDDKHTTYTIRAAIGSVIAWPEGKPS